MHLDPPTTADSLPPSQLIAAHGLWFTAIRTAEILDEQVAPPQPGQVTVRAIVSLVSSGTELLI